MKYTQSQVEEIFKEHDFILKDTYINNKTSVFCVDNDGYKYNIKLMNILKGRELQKVHSQNPYTLENIDLYIKINGITSKRLSLEYVDSKTDMEWECECGKSFFTTWNEFQQGKHYCNFCAKSRRFNGLRDYMLLIQEECNRRGYRLLTDYIHRSTDYFQYVCNKHLDQGVQKSSYDIMVNCNRGCYYCGIESRGEKHRRPESEVKALTESKGFIYAGLDYNNNGKKSKRVNIHIICPKHIHKGVQIVNYDNLEKNTGMCIYCMGYGRTKEDLQIELDEMHGLITILDYIDYVSPIQVKCNICGHKWSTTGVNLTQGHRCPNCNKSIFELSVGNILDKYGYVYMTQYTYPDCVDKRPLPFDYYLPDYNILIEVDGEQHYKPINFGGISNEEAQKNLEIVQHHDQIKTQYCTNNRIPLIRIPYWERDNLQNFLLEKLSNIINIHN